MIELKLAGVDQHPEQIVDALSTNEYAEMLLGTRPVQFDGGWVDGQREGAGLCFSSSEAGAASRNVTTAREGRV